MATEACPTPASVMMDEDEEEIEDNDEGSESNDEEVDDEQSMEEDVDLRSDSFDDYEEVSPEPAPAPAEDMRSNSFDDYEEGSPEPASAPAPAPCVRVGGTVLNVTVADADALECGVCFIALTPIFQCEVGHVVCAACRVKLEATGNGKCHVCGVATRGCYRRCYAMEHLVDCIRVPCRYAAHGCDAKPPYHGQESHRQVCPHAPCRCPGESCGFVGSTTALLDHFADAHGWPCTTKVSAGETFSIRLRGGFNFFQLTNDQAAEASSSSVPYLFLLNVTKERLGRAISVLCIHPHATAAAASADHQPLSTQCGLIFARYSYGSLCRALKHYQASEFRVLCTDLSKWAAQRRRLLPVHLVR